MINLDARGCLHTMLKAPRWGPATDGANVASYKAMVANVSTKTEERREGQQSGSQRYKGGDKRNGIARDRQGAYRQEESYSRAMVRDPQSMEDR